MSLVSIIIPTRNRLALLKETLTTLSAQTYPHWEAIVIDDGSNDGTEEFLARQTANDRRFRYFRRKSNQSGANVCRNEGARQSNAEYLIFLDSDDLLDSTCVEQRQTFMKRNQDLDFCVFQGEAFGDGTGGVNKPFSIPGPGSDLDRFLYLDFPWQTTGPIWRRSAFLNIGGFDETLPSWQDVELHIRAIASGLSWLRVDATDHYIRWQNDPMKTSLQQRHHQEHLRSAEKMFEGIANLLRSRGQLTWTRRRALAGLFFLSSERWIDCNELGSALRAWMRARAVGLIDFPLLCSGTAMLLAERFLFMRRSIGFRIIHYWKGRVRFREQPSLLANLPRTKDTAVLSRWTEKQPDRHRRLNSTAH